MTTVSLTQKRRQAHRAGDEKAETEAVQPSSTECLGPPGAARSQEAFSLRAFRGSVALAAHGFQPPEL